LLDYLVECGVCSKESFVYITRITFARRKQVCACAHKIMKRVHWEPIGNAQLESNGHITSRDRMMP